MTTLLRDSDDGTLDLFERPEFAVPDWLAYPGSRIEHEFKAYHTANPHVYAALEQAALRWQATEPKRIGIARLYENARYAQLAVDRERWEYKLNNNFRALYARLLIHRHPRLEGVIEIRVRKEKGATSE